MKRIRCNKPKPPPRLKRTPVKNPSEILAKILSIIDEDVQHISDGNTKKQLEAAVALTLTRYAATLNEIVKSNERETQRLKQSYAAMPTEDLIKAFQEKEGK